jgi:hypothetical protein
MALCLIRQNGIHKISFTLWRSTMNKFRIFYNMVLDLKRPCGWERYFPKPLEQLGATLGQSVQRLSEGWTAETRRKNFLFLDVLQTASGAHWVSYPTGTGSLFAGVKRLGREVDHLPQPLPYASSIFLNPLLFASCTDTFSKWCKITRGMKRSAQ